MNDLPSEHLDEAPKNFTASPRPGEMLRNAREAQGLHIAALAVALKVPVKKLEALEADRFDLLPDIVFVRALALSVCRALKIDATPVMAGLPQLLAPQIKTDESGLNAQFRTSGTGIHGVILDYIKSPVGIAIIALLLAIAAVLFWPSSETKTNALIPDGSTGLSESTPLPSGVSATTPNENRTVAATGQATINLIETSQIALPVIPSSGTTSAADVSFDNPILTLNARGSSWVEVIDAAGKTQLSKITSDGEVLRVSGALPLTVVVGRADLVTVIVRGEALDIGSASKDGVARFEVK